MQTEEFEMHASTKIIVVTGFTTELHAGRQQVHFSILQPFLLTTYGNSRRLEDIVSDKLTSESENTFLYMCDLFSF